VAPIALCILHTALIQADSPTSLPPTPTLSLNLPGTPSFSPISLRRSTAVCFTFPLFCPTFSQSERLGQWCKLPQLIFNSVQLKLETFCGTFGSIFVSISALEFPLMSKNCLPHPPRYFIYAFCRVHHVPQRPSSHQQRLCVAKYLYNIIILLNVHYFYIILRCKRKNKKTLRNKWSKRTGTIINNLS